MINIDLCTHLCSVFTKKETERKVCKLQKRLVLPLFLCIDLGSLSIERNRLRKGFHPLPSEHCVALDRHCSAESAEVFGRVYAAPVIALWTTAEREFLASGGQGRAAITLRTDGQQPPRKYPTSPSEATTPLAGSLMRLGTGMSTELQRITVHNRERFSFAKGAQNLTKNTHSPGPLKEL